MIMTGNMGDGWHYKVRPTRTGHLYLAWCAKTVDLKDGPLDIPRHIEVHAEFGDSADEAVTALFTSMGRKRD